MVWVRSPVYFYKRGDTFYFSRAVPSDFYNRLMVVENHQFLRHSWAAVNRNFNLIGVSLTLPREARRSTTRALRGCHIAVVGGEVISQRLQIA